MGKSVFEEDEELLDLQYECDVGVVALVRACEQRNRRRLLERTGGRRVRTTRI